MKQLFPMFCCVGPISFNLDAYTEHCVLDKQLPYLESPLSLFKYSPASAKEMHFLTLYTKAGSVLSELVCSNVVEPQFIGPTESVRVSEGPQ